MKQKLFSLIKITSTVLITCALGLEIWQIYLQLTNASLPSQLYPISWLANIALIAHFIEGAIASWKASSSHLNFITYGIYTFFVGFIGLLELQETLANSEK
jgi:hypothetical protein